MLHLVMKVLLHTSQEIYTYVDITTFPLSYHSGVSSGGQMASVPGTEVSDDSCLVHLGRFHRQVLHPPDAMA